MRKVFDLLNRINKLQIPIDSNNLPPNNGMNAKVKMGERITVVLNGVQING